MKFLGVGYFGVALGGAGTAGEPFVFSVAAVDVMDEDFLGTGNKIVVFFSSFSFFTQ